MNSPTPHTELLRSLDPARETLGLTPAERGRRDALLASFDETASSIPGAERPRWSRHPRRTIFTLASAAAALALVTAIAVTALPGASNPPAVSYALPAHGSLASWTSSPQHTNANPADVQACATALGFDADPGHPATALTSEKRGDFTSLVIEQNTHDGYCVLSTGVVENWFHFDRLQAHRLADATAATVSEIQGSEWMYVASGLAGANVTRIAVTIPDTGATSNAAIANGVWSAWWPVGQGDRASGPSAPGYADDVSIAYTLADGTTRTSTGITNLDSDADSKPEPGTPPSLSSLAGWASTSTQFMPSVVEVDTCATAVAGWPAGSTSVVLAESRGSFQTLLLDRAGDRAFCVLKSGMVQWSLEMGTPSAPRPSNIGVGAAAALVSLSGTDGAVPGTRIDTATGTADAGITTVTVHLAAGNDVQAAVQNGTWMAWWPEDEPAALNGAIVDGTTITAKPAPTLAPTDAPVPADPPTISFTTADGVEHTPVN